MEMQAWMQYHQMMHMNMAAAAAAASYQGSGWRLPPMPGAWPQQQQQPTAPGALMAMSPTVNPSGASGITGVTRHTTLVGPDSTPSQAGRQQAVAKYREKRKARESNSNANAANRIRYQTRKVLAEARPRVRGQFVRVHKDALGGQGAAEVVSPPAPEDGSLAQHASGTVTGGNATLPHAPGQGVAPGAAADGQLNVAEPMDDDSLDPSSEDDVANGKGPEGSPKPDSIEAMAVDASAVPVGSPASKHPAKTDSESATQPVLVVVEGRRARKHGAAKTGVAAVAAPAPMPSPKPHVSGHKHRRQLRAVQAAPTADTKTEGRSDSGSNSPNDGDMTLDARMLPPAKHQHK